MTAPIRALTSPPPCPDVIACLREMLELAESGELQSVAGVGIKVGGDAVTFGTHGKARADLQLVGAIRVLEFRMVEGVER